MSSISEVFEKENDKDIEDNNHGIEVYWGDQELGKTKESAVEKEIVLLDDKIHGYGDVKKSIQKEEQKFQILEDFIEQVLRMMLMVQMMRILRVLRMITLLKPPAVM
ncbi:hypothetical protein GH714_037059 [Hevea brasiliensis]|uniref:Uncharacterized protein n=1 Tax=Hevea brasiliensis TaxID=3981 RepID=A0A6A6M5V9_HEVBR|nr:hypothetical protein GH714_037059 [Hevea brasiliensis]